MNDITLTPIERGTITADHNHVIEGFVTATADDPNPDLAMSESPVYNVVIEHPEATMLWDTGSHPEAASGYWPGPLYSAFEHTGLDSLEDDLAEAGYSLAEIDLVIQSHLHLDHAGGLYAFAGSETPIYVHRRELEYAYRSAKTDTGGDAYIADDFDRDLEWRLVRGDGQSLFYGLELLHLPGHTPGHMGVRIELGEETVIIAGDLAYVRENYEDEHPMGGGLLWSKRHWKESLRRVKDIERRHDAIVICGHEWDDLEQLHELSSQK